MNARRPDDVLANAGRAAETVRDRLTAPIPGAIRDAIGDEIGRPRSDINVDLDVQVNLEARPGPRRRVRGLLLSHASLRQAMILTEVLGPPKALRRSE